VCLFALLVSRVGYRLLVSSSYSVCMSSLVAMLKHLHAGACYSFSKTLRSHSLYAHVRCSYARLHPAVCCVFMLVASI
jgi:hypothetical protein